MQVVAASLTLQSLAMEQIYVKLQYIVSPRPLQRHNVLCNPLQEISGKALFSSIDDLVKQNLKSRSCVDVAALVYFIAAVLFLCSSAGCLGQCGCD